MSSTDWAGSGSNSSKKCCLPQALSRRSDASAEFRKELVPRSKENRTQKPSSSRRHEALIDPRNRGVNSRKPGGFHQELTVDLPMVMQHQGIHIDFRWQRQVSRHVAG